MGRSGREGECGLVNANGCFQEVGMVEALSTRESCAGVVFEGICDILNEFRRHAVVKSEEMSLG